MTDTHPAPLSPTSDPPPPLPRWPYRSWPVRFCNKSSKYPGQMWGMPKCRWSPLGNTSQSPTQGTKHSRKLGGSTPESALYMWSCVEPAHLGSHWLSPLQKDCHSCCTGGRGLLGDRGTAHCGVHMNARWSPQGSSHMGGMNRCPVVGSGTPVREWIRGLRSEIRA